MRPRGLLAPLAIAAAAGALAVAGALAEAELLAGITGTVSLLDAVGGLVISLEPPGAKDVAVGLFGDADKVALLVVVVLGAIGVGAVLGAVARRRFRVAAVGMVVLGAVGALAAARQPLVPAATAIVAGALATGTAVGLLAGLLRAAEPHVADANEPSRVGSAADGGAGLADPVATWQRRRFLIASAAVIGGSAAGLAVGRRLVADAHPDAVVTSTKLPATAIRALDPGAGESLDIPGLAPIVTPAARLYRIDTELEIPQVDVAQWRLEVTGMVDHPLTLTYDDLLAFPLYEQYIALACVSNEVGGHLVGSPLWTGARLKDVLAEAGVQPAATQIMGRSWSDFSAGFPTSWAMDPAREPLIAVGMDRDVLPAAHGFPARLVVPGLFGYVSATKWLTQIELTTREAQDGFWIPLGWAKDGPMLTQSRIDVPAFGVPLAAGPTTVAGVAWAGDRGVSAVELRVDGGSWQPARVTRPLSAAAWVQWSAAWSATPGEHLLEVRATDCTGEVQADEVTRPAPSGARGHHKVNVLVE